MVRTSPCLTEFRPRIWFCKNILTWIYWIKQPHWNQWQNYCVYLSTYICFVWYVFKSISLIYILSHDSPCFKCPNEVVEHNKQICILWVQYVILSSISLLLKRQNGKKLPTFMRNNYRCASTSAWVCLLFKE